MGTPSEPLSRQPPKFLPLDNTSVFSPPVDVACGVCGLTVYGGGGVQAFVPMIALSYLGLPLSTLRVPAVLHRACWRGDA